MNVKKTGWGKYSVLNTWCWEKLMTTWMKLDTAISSREKFCCYSFAYACIYTNNAMYTWLFYLFTEKYLTNLICYY